MKKNDYKDWIELRNNSLDEHNEKLCYCGHTDKCTCGDPENGWKKTND